MSECVGHLAVTGDFIETEYVLVVIQLSLLYMLLSCPFPCLWRRMQADPPFCCRLVLPSRLWVIGVKAESEGSEIELILIIVHSLCYWSFPNYAHFLNSIIEIITQIPPLHSFDIAAVVIVFVISFGLICSFVPRLQCRGVVRQHVEVHVSFGELRGSGSQVLELGVDEHAIKF